MVADSSKSSRLNVMQQKNPESGIGWQIDDLLLEPDIRQLSRNGQLIRLPALSFEVLRVLATSAPEPVSVQALIDAAWQGAVVSDETVTQRIKLLRQALGDDGRNPQYIEAVRGRGYRLLSVPVKHAGNRHSNHFKAGLVTVILLALVIGVFSARYFSSQPPSELANSVAGSATAQDYIQQANEYLSRHQQLDNGLAINLFRQAIDLQPDNPRAVTGLSQALTQSVTKFNADQQRLYEAQALAEQIIANHPQLYNGWLALAASLDGQGAVVPAIEAYQQALSISPQHIGAKASLGYLYQVHGELVKALRLNLEVFGSADQLHYWYLQVAQILYLLGFDPAAEPLLERTDELQPDNVFAAENRARFLLVNRRFEEAEQVLNNAVQRGVMRSELWLELGLLDLLRDDLPAAELRFDQALQVEPENGQAQAWPLIIKAMRGQLDESQYQHKINVMQMDIQAGDSWPSSYLQVASLQAAYGDHSAALDTIEQLYPAGFRDHRMLMLWPTFAALLSDERFQSEIARMQQDIAQQRDAVLRADWVPRELLFAQPVPPATHNQ